MIQRPECERGGAYARSENLMRNPQASQHRCRVERVRAHTLIWKVTCYTCRCRYLTDGGWYDAMRHARKHWAEHNVRPTAGHYLIDQLTTVSSPIELRQRGPKGPYEFR